MSKKRKSIIQILREEKGLSQRKLALAINTEAITISRYESFKMIPAALNLWRLREYFGISADEIINDYIEIIRKQNKASHNNFVKRCKK